MAHTFFPRRPKHTTCAWSKVQFVYIRQRHIPVLIEGDKHRLKLTAHARQRTRLHASDNMCTRTHHNANAPALAHKIAQSPQRAFVVIVVHACHHRARVSMFRLVKTN
jgi:hypothetical protein